MLSWVRKNISSVILIAALLAVSLIFVIVSGLKKSSGTYVVITQDGETVYEGMLTEDTYVRIDSGSGYNVFKAEKDGDRLGLKCIESDCPEQICVDRGTVVLTDDPIVCLPHKVTARLTDK